MALLEVSGMLVVVLNPKGRIVSFNPACERLSEWRFDEVRGVRLWDVLIAAEDAPAIRGVFNDLVTGRFPTEHENDWLARAGEQRCIHWKNTIIADTAGAVQHVVATGIDITERKRMEEALQQAHNINEAILDTAVDGIVCVDTLGRIAHFNSGGQAYVVSRLSLMGEMASGLALPPAELMVLDTGVGLPTGVPERVFDPLFTTKPNGIGVGLSISRSIVRAHGGHSRIQPSAGRGGLLRRHIAHRRRRALTPAPAPALRSAASLTGVNVRAGVFVSNWTVAPRMRATQEATVTSQADNRSAQIVFIVDDDRSVRDSVKLLVQSYGWSAQAFESAEAFLDRCLAARRCGCLVLDLHMPGMNGTELQEELRRRGWDIPVVIMTAHHEEALIRRAERAGVHSVLMKPFRDEELVARIDAALRQGSPRAG